MLAKSLVVTDDSEYIKETFFKDEQKPLVTFELPQIQDLPNQVQNLLEHPSQIEEIAENGYYFAKKYHTWERRAQYMYENYLK